MLEPEERRISIIESLKKNIAELPKKIDLLEWYVKKAKALDLDHVYERADRQTMDLFTRQFAYFYNILTKDFYIIITILSELNVHWMNQEGYYIEDMEKLGLIDDVETFEKIKRTKKSIDGEFLIYDETKFWEECIAYSDVLIKLADKAVRYAKEKFIDQ